MRLRQTSRRFDDTSIEVFDPLTSTWSQSTQRVNVQVADRFISDRSFGQRKRNLLSAEPIEQDVLRYAGQIYCRESQELDMEGSDVLGYITMVHELPFACTWVRLVTQKRFNGDPTGVVVRDPVAQSWCDIDRYSAEEQRDLQGDYVNFNVTFPKYLLPVITSDLILVADGIDYDIDQVAHNVDAGWARAVRRGAPE